MKVGIAMGEVKFYRITGKMLIRHDKMPEWQKFTQYVRAIKPEHALEKVYSELGSNHRVKRYHLVVEKIEEVELEEVEDRNIAQLAFVKRWNKLE